MPRKKTFQWHADGETDGVDAPSRSARKRQSTALQKLGEQLAALDAAARSALPLTPDLAEALRLYDKIRDREGRRRQMQYIGRLMREVDAAPIEEALAARGAARQADAALLHRAEQWRAALLEAAPETLRDMLTSCLPGADAATLEKLERTALAARAESPGSPPHARRALFRELTAAMKNS